MSTSVDMSTGKLVYSFKVSAEQVAELKRIKAKTGATVGEQIRRGIDLWIQKQRRTTK